MLRYAETIHHQSLGQEPGIMSPSEHPGFLQDSIGRCVRRLRRGEAADSYDNPRAYSSDGKSGALIRFGGRFTDRSLVYVRFPQTQPVPSEPRGGNVPSPALFVSPFVSPVSEGGLAA